MPTAERAENGQLQSRREAPTAWRGHHSGGIVRYETSRCRLSRSPVGARHGGHRRYLGRERRHGGVSRVPQPRHTRRSRATRLPSLAARGVTARRVPRARGRARRALTGARRPRRFPESSRRTRFSARRRCRAGRNRGRCRGRRGVPRPPRVSPDGLRGTRASARRPVLYSRHRAARR